MKGEMEELIELVITKDSPALGKSIGQLQMPDDTTIVLLLRENEKPRIPGADTILREKDRIIALTTTNSEKSIERNLLG